MLCKIACTFERRLFFLAFSLPHAAPKKRHALAGTDAQEGAGGYIQEYAQLAREHLPCVKK
jgi:hypothetical protein